MMHFLISSLRSLFVADASPPVVRIRVEIIALDDDVGWARDDDGSEYEFASSVVVGGTKEHESLDCGHVVVLTINAASGAVLRVDKIAEVPSEQPSVKDSPLVAEVDETGFECHCVVTRVVGGRNLGDVMVDVDGGKRFSFQLRTCPGDFRPKTDDELTIKLKILKDGQEVPISFKAAREEEWREACVVREASFGNRNCNRRPELGALRYRNKEATFDAHVVKGCKFLPRCDEVVYARVIGTSDRIRPWRAIDVKTRTLGLQAGALLSGADSTKNVEPKGLFVQEELDFGYVKRDQRVELPVHIRNDSKQLFTLRCASFDDPVAREIFQLTPDRFPAAIAPGTTLRLTLACHRAGCDDIPASDTLPFHFRFAGGVSIDRMVHAMFRESVGKDDRLFQRTTRAPRLNASRKWAAFETYSLPPQLMKIAREGGDVLKLYPCLTDPLTPENYVYKFKAMIHLQHMGEACELSKMRLTGVTMETRGECLTLNVPDLKEGRPSLVVSDLVIVSELRSIGGKTHEGRIVEIRDLTVFLKFDHHFQNIYRGQEVDVSFKVGVGGYVRGNHALSRLNDGRVKQLVFPVKELEMKPVMQVEDEGLLRPYRRPNGIVRAQRDSYPMFAVEEEATKVFKVRWFNADLNEKQRQAVKYIVSSGSRIPYLIFGPPGTGKTVTVVEAVMQVFHMDPSSRIMVATPSNSAADLICSLLGHYVEKGWLEKTRLVRFLAQQRNTASVPDSVRDFVVQDDPEDQALSDECVKRIAETRIMVATWHMCGSLHPKSIRSDFFSHVFVDEAGHLTEPECLVPMTLCDAKRVILAGDPEQLGPVILSEPAKRFGMCESMLERLMRGNQAYQRDASVYPEYGGYDPMVVTKLVENYRSRPKILELYSNLCYAGDLVPRVPDDGVPLWVPDSLKNRFPLLVVGIRGGVCQRDSKNPSPFNEVELFYVHLYAVMLTGRGISARDVGIVTPYRRQAQKIREKLRDTDLDEVKVGTVEEFQGSERRVIIVSTVHTVKTAEGKRRWSDDGFWANSFFSSKRHTNVAISRAQDFLVVIGDVELLTKDEHWSQIVSKARDGGDKHFLLVGQRL